MENESGAVHPRTVTLPGRTAATLTRDRRLVTVTQPEALHAPRTMTLTPATRLARSRWWPGVAAWALWTLTMLALPVIAWLDQLSRQAGRPELAQLTLGSVVGPV